MKKREKIVQKAAAWLLSAVMLVGFIPEMGLKAQATQNDSAEIKNDSLQVKIGDLGQIETMNIVGNPQNSYNEDINFVLPNNTSPQNNENHQWMGEMIFSYRTSGDGSFAGDFTEVDTNKTIAAGGSTTYDNATENLVGNPYIDKNQTGNKVTIDYIGHDTGSTTDRAIKDFNVKSVFDMDTADNSLAWEITLENDGSDYIEFGDVGLPMPWNNKYSGGTTSIYNRRVTAHTFAGADSGYAYAIRSSGEGNYILFTPVIESGARIEYVDNWMGTNNGVTGERAGSLYTNWTADSGGWQPGLSVYYIHSKDIQKTGRGYYTDATSLVLAPGESKTYQFKFSGIRAGDNDPSVSANNTSDSMNERESNMRSVLYKEGLIDAMAVPGFQTAINMPTKLALHYDVNKVKDVTVEVQNVLDNDPFDAAHIPDQKGGMVNNNRTGRGKTPNVGYSKSAVFTGTETVDGETYHIYDLSFDLIGNNSARVEYKALVNGQWEDKFTQYEFNVLTELDEAVNAHATFMTENQSDADPNSETFGILKDWYFASGADSSTKSHWGDDWSHDNINFLTMKNYLTPNAQEVEAIENYLIDFMWENYMANTQESYTVANYLAASGVYTDLAAPYTRTYSEIMEATAFFNMYQVVSTYPNLIDYRENALFYLEKAYGIYYNRMNSSSIGFYGEQQIPDMIEALKKEGMTEEADKLQVKFAQKKGSTMAESSYPYASEFGYDNTGEEGAYAASKALLTYYPGDANASNAISKMSMTDLATRAKRGIQPTWYHYGVPVFLGGEAWWNFQYTASLAGYVMDDWLRYQDNGYSTEDMAWAERVNYAAKLSNFNAINMGQIADTYVGNVSWRYTMYKGGHGAMNVYDGGTRVMNNGWNDFSGEADEGIYGSLMSISADVVTDPVFGLYGYGAEITKTGGVYTIKPLDGIGKRVNILDEKLYISSQQDKISELKVNSDGKRFELQLENLTGNKHLSKINLSGAGLVTGYYSLQVGGINAGQVFVDNTYTGTAMFIMPQANTETIVIEKTSGGANSAPEVSIATSTATPQARLPVTLNGIAIDDGAPSGSLEYKWEVIEAPSGGTMTLETPNATTTQAVGTVAGDYKLRLTVGDGEKEGNAEFTVTLLAPPAKTAPIIGEVTATQDVMNPSVIKLSGKATADPLYNDVLTYHWEVVSSPAGSSVAFGNADKEDAQLKISQAGEYILKFTAIDGSISSIKEVEIQADGNIDGIERATNVVTEVGTAPTLPASIEVILPDGSIAEETVIWDTVPSASYETPGTFSVSGKAGSNEIMVAIIVYVVKNQEVNMALVATPSAIINTPQDLGGVTTMNDGNDPTNSRDTSKGVWHNWLGDQGGTAWVQYDWDTPFVATGMDVYVFRDGGGNFQPKDMKVQLRDQDGGWYTPRGIEGLDNRLNLYNFTSFEPANITGMRIDMKPNALGCGIIEWKVYGYGEMELTDKSYLRELITTAESLNSSLITAGYDEVQAELINAAEVDGRSSATQEEIDKAAQALASCYKQLVPLNGNVAFVAGVSVSFVSSWEKKEAVNDGSSTNGKHLGTWGNDSAFETVTYTWPTGASVSKSDVVFWNDGGGILTPGSYEYQYLNAKGNWISLGNIPGTEIVDNDSNITEFDEEIQMWALKVIINKKQADSQGVGILEWETHGSVLDWSKVSTDPEKPIGEGYRNLAIEAVPSVEYTCNDGYDGVLEAINDGKLPNSSSDFIGGKVGGEIVGQNAWHNWGQELNETAYLQYTWSVPVVIDKTASYYFKNGAGHFIPSKAMFQYLDSEGNWVEVSNVSGAGVETDKLNESRFDSITTTAMRMVMTKDNLALGVFEWEVYGICEKELKKEYTLNFETNGGSKLENVKAEAGKNIDLAQYTPTKAGYQFDGWCIDKNLTKAATSIRLEEDQTVYAKWKKEPKLEARLNTEDIITYISGYENGTVRPGGNIKRAEVAQILYILLTKESREEYKTNSNGFTDVFGGHWANTAISTLANAGILSGYEDKSFAPDKNISRAELIQVVAKLVEKTDVDTSKVSFPDIKGHWAKENILYAGAKGWIKGYPDGTFQPSQNITRAEAITIINAVLGRKTSDIGKIKNMKTFTDNANKDAWYYAQIQIAANTY